MDSQMIKFLGYHLFLKTFQSNKDSFRVEIETGIDQYDKIKNIPLLPEGVYEIEIKPKINES